MIAKHTFFKSQNFIEGVCFIAFAGLIFFQTIDDSSDASLFPRVMAAIIALMGAIIIYQAWIQFKQGSPSEKKETNQSFKSALIVIAALGLFWLLHQFVGFYATSFLLVMFFYFFFDKKKTAFAVIKGIMFSVFMTGLLYFIFHKALRLLTPTGILF